MKKIKRMLSDIEQFSPFIRMIKDGATPQEIHNEIVSTLRPYIKDEDILKKFAVPFLTIVYVNIKLIQNDNWAFSIFKKCHALILQAESANKDKVIQAIIKLLPELESGLSKVISARMLEPELEELEIEELSMLIFEHIGIYIEAASKPLLYFLLYCTKVTRLENDTLTQVQTKDLGQVINELLQKTDLDDFLKPHPWNIRLNQWRNISQHYSIKIQEGTVHCLYGRPNDIRTLTFADKNELIDVYKKVHIIFLILRTVWDVFSYARTQEFKGLNLKSDSGYKDEGNLLLVVEMALHGFEVIEIDESDDTVRIKLKDIVESDPKFRSSKAFVLTYNAWLYFYKDIVGIDYCNQSGEIYLSSTARGKDCENMAKGVISFDEMLEKIDYKLHN